MKTFILYAILLLGIGTLCVIKDTLTSYCCAFYCGIMVYVLIKAARQDYSATRKIWYENRLYEQSTRW